MLYPAYIQVGDDKHAHGIEVPDVPGCFSAADDWQEINRMAQEAVECHMAGETGPLPEPTPLEKLSGDARYVGGVWMLVDLDLARIDPAPKRVNISLPGSLLKCIEEHAEARNMSRSGFLAQAAARAMESEGRRE